jgi:exopolyphosphatase / guanosine-5'-triphosphate,3'-diphosphate pyrophosphatase
MRLLASGIARTGSRGAKGNRVEDPDLDGRPSMAGASPDFPADHYGGSPSGGGVAARPAASSAPNGQQPPDAQKKHPARKRRKRKRGRKVFARDAVYPASGTKQPSPEFPGSPRAAAENPMLVQAAVAALASGRLPFAVRGRPDFHSGVFAALDLGTNNCRLLVAVPTRPGQFRVIDAFSRIVRLGEGLTGNGRLGEAAMERALEALKICADKLGLRQVRRARLIATEACRSAENGMEFLDRVERETGLALEVISRETEARLAVSGCSSLVDAGTQGVVLFDIGGGSSEIALVDVSQRRSHDLASHIRAWTSLPVGVVSLAEKFGGLHVTRDVFNAMVGEVRDMLMAFKGRNRLSHVSRSRFHLLGTSGTVTTLAGVHLGLERYDRRRVDGLWMSSANVDAMTEKLISWDFQQRVANPCIGADRADLVLAGCAILEAIRSVWPSERLRVADRGLREGILNELMAEEGVWRRDPRPI